MRRRPFCLLTGVLCPQLLELTQVLASASRANSSSLISHLNPGPHEMLPHKRGEREDYGFKPT